MKPQKKALQKQSIRDFFSPAPKGQPGSSGAPLPSGGTLSSQTSTTLSQDKPPPPVPKTPQLTTASPSALPSRAAPLSASTTPFQPVKSDPQLPPPSQGSTASGASKRAVSNGDAVVLNSDSDSDSLPDLNWGTFTSATVKPTVTARSKRSVDDNGDELRKPQKKGKSRKFEKIVETAQKNVSLEQKILHHKADLEKPLEEERGPETTINEHTLAQAVDNDDDPDRARRLFLAMQRTNATQTNHVYHFFTHSSESSVKPRFPTRCLPKTQWAKEFHDSHARDEAFMTGFARQIFRLQELPEEVASWMIDQICLTCNDSLSLKYMEILDAHHDHYGVLLNQDRLDSIIAKLGGHVDLLRTDGEVMRSFDVLSKDASPLPSSVRMVAKLLQRAAPWLPFKTKVSVLHVLCFMCMDDRVATETNVLQPVQRAIEAILCNFTDREQMNKALNDLVPHLLAHIIDPILQRTLVCALPTQSPLTADFQRHLALSFILYPDTHEYSVTDPQVPALIHKHLDQSPHFQVNKETSYGALAARLVMLDIAIGPGLLTVPHQPLISLPQSQDLSSLVIPPAPSSSEIKTFNAEVDALAQHIKLVGNSVVEASASVDLTILEAKDCVERLCARLEHAVRIGGRKVQNIFGSDEDDRQLKVTDIFRKAAMAQKAAATGIFADDDDDGDAVSAQIHAEIRASQ